MAAFSTTEWDWDSWGEWYVLRVRAGCESKVIDEILQSISRSEIKGLLDAFAPKSASADRVPARSFLFPGYVLVHCHFSDALAGALLAIPGVAGFAFATDSGEDFMEAPKSVDPADVKRLREM